MKIGLLSDTHGWIHPGLFKFFDKCDEIWHAGDIGNIETADALSGFRPFRAVYGNIDNAEVRSAYPDNLRFLAGEVRVWMTHIGGNPARYDIRVRTELKSDPPDLFICGHSHIAKIIWDKRGFLYVNPGAAGYIGFHKFMTAVRFSIDGKRIHGMELIELGERGQVTI